MTLTSSAYGVHSQDIAAVLHNGEVYHCYVWKDEDAPGIGTTCFIKGPQGKDRVLWSRKLIQQSGATEHLRPKIVGRGSIFIVFYYLDDVTPALRYAYINVATLSGISDWTDVQYTTDVDSSALFDVHEVEGHANDYLLVYEDGSNQIEFERLSINGAATPVEPIWTNAIAENPESCLACYASDDSDIVVAAYQSSSGTTRIARFDSTGGAGSINAQFGSVTPTYAYKAGMCRLSSTETALVAEARVIASGTDLRGLYYCKFNNTTGSRSTPIQVTPWLSMLSRPWALDNAEAVASDVDIYCVAGYQSRLASPNNHSQRNVFVVNMDHQLWGNTAGTAQVRPCSNMNLGNGVAHYADNNCVSHVVPHALNGAGLKTRTIAGRIFTRITKSTGRVIPATPMIVGWVFYPEDPWLKKHDAVSLSGESESWWAGVYPWVQFQNGEVGKGLFINGGTPAWYDGQQVVELGFCWFPEIHSTAQGTTGSLTQGGVYNYAVVAEWRDARGQLHRSAPSIPLEVTMTGANDSLTLTIGCITLTTKQGLRWPNAPAITFAVYRTVDNGAIFYRTQVMDSPSEYVINDTTAFQVTYDDDTADSVLEDNEILPYQLDAAGLWTPLENFQPPSSTCWAIWQNRVWLASSEDFKTLWYSKEIQPEAGGIITTPPEFSAYLTYRVEEGGAITALCQMDQYLVVFKADRVFIVAGITADDSGANQQLSSQTIARGIGCVSPETVVLGSFGVFFQSEKGFYLLSRSLEVEYIGQAIEDKIRSVGNVRSVVLHESNHQVRMVCEKTDKATQYCLVFDYLHKMWMWWELPSASATAEDSRVVAGIQWRGYVSDNPLAVLTQGGYVHVEQFGANAYADENSSSATNLVPMTITTGWIKVAGISGWWRARAIVIELQRHNNATIKVEVAYDFSDTYDDSFYFETSTDEPIRVRPSKQRFSNFRLRITDEDDPGYAQNFSISAITIEAKRKNGNRRIDDRKVGT